jgi:hypothetical protein
VKRLLSKTLAALAAISCPGCGPTTIPPDNGLKPFAASDGNGIHHNLYRNLKFEQVSATLPAGSVDALDIDGTAPNGVIVLVTATIGDSPQTEFTTTFKTNDNHNFAKTWKVASGNKGKVARGLFVVTSSVTGASTVRNQSK